MRFGLALDEEPAEEQTPPTSPPHFRIRQVDAEWLGERQRMAQQQLESMLSRLTLFETQLAQRHRERQQAFKHDMDAQRRAIASHLHTLSIARRQEDSKRDEEFQVRQEAQLRVLKQTLRDAAEREQEIQRRKDDKRRREEEQKRLVEEEARLKREAEDRRLQLEREQAALEQQREQDLLRKTLELQQERDRQRVAEIERNQAVLCRGRIDGCRCKNDIMDLPKRLHTLKHSLTKSRQVKSNRAMMNEAIRYRMQFTTKKAQEITGILAKGQAASELLYTWLLNNLASTEVSANLKKAYPLAMLFCLVAAQHPQLVPFLMGRLYKKCIYLIPRYLSREKDESNEAFRERLGYKKTDRGFETELQYQERMYGFVALFAAIIQSDLSSFGQRNPMDGAMGWTLMARWLNMPPRKITPGLLHTFLKVFYANTKTKVAGPVMVQQYGKQMRKLLILIKTDVSPQMTQEGIEAARTKLMLLVEDYLKTGVIEWIEGASLRP